MNTPPISSGRAGVASLGLSAWIQTWSAPATQCSSTRARIVAASLGGLVNALGSADVQPTANQLSAISAARAVAARVMTRWRAIDTVELAALNAGLKTAGVEPIK